MRSTPPTKPGNRSTYLHRQVIGYLGLILPVLLWFMAGERPTEGIPERWGLLPSASAYYYTGAVVAFVGVLAALAVFLLTYRGYDNGQWKDRTAATIAGLAAILVASFPTGAPASVPPPSWWTERIGLIHGTAATVLFASFIFFSLFLFTRSNTKKPTAGKQTRNAIYVVCGLAMTSCMLWAIVQGTRKAPIFWPEALALEFFALSWLAKGRAEYTAGVVVARTIHYGRHPHLLLER